MIWNRLPGKHHRVRITERSTLTSVCSRGKPSVHFFWILRIGFRGRWKRRCRSRWHPWRCRCLRRHAADLSWRLHWLACFNVCAWMSTTVRWRPRTASLTCWGWGTESCSSRHTSTRDAVRSWVTSYWGRTITSRTVHTLDETCTQMQHSHNTWR
jgi:hypothetical protein